jgi:predicted Zn-dependent protease
MAENEDELAAILAHEIQHIVNKDPLKAIKSQRMKSLGTFAAGEAMGSSSEVLSIFKNSVLDITGTLLQKGYSRGQEKDADLQALNLLDATGYNPQALLAMLEKCRGIEKKKAKAFSAHPSASKRSDYVSAALGKNVGNDMSARNARFRKSVSR